jgi:hypothetical protein
VSPELDTSHTVRTAQFPAIYSYIGCGILKVGAKQSNKVASRRVTAAAILWQKLRRTLMQQVHVTTSVAELLGRTAQRGPVSMLRHSQRCATLQQPRRVCRRSSVRPPVLAAYAATAVAAPGIDTVTAAARNAGGFFPPPLLVKPDEAALRANRPFLTTDAGMLPVLPRNLGHALFNYDGYAACCTTAAE